MPLVDAMGACSSAVQALYEAIFGSTGAFAFDPGRVCKRFDSGVIDARFGKGLINDPKGGQHAVPLAGQGMTRAKLPGQALFGPP
jgi:hypothetical protein